MTRLPIAAFLAIAACGVQPDTVESTAWQSALVRGGTAEVKLRCGSETLRTRLRQGQIIARKDNGESTILSPVTDSRAGSGPAYSDGRLTLYKVPDAQSWTLARGNSPPSDCKASAPGA
jgi:hypothetical protein